MDRRATTTDAIASTTTSALGGLAPTSSSAAPTTTTILRQATARATTSTTGHRPAPTSTSATAASSNCTVAPANKMQATGGGSQLITVVAASSEATSAAVTLWQRAGACWSVAGGPWSGWVGFKGLSSHKMEGDDTTPIGLFGISSTFYGIDPNPGVHGSYHQLVCGDWWDEEPSSQGYNTFQHVNSCSTANPFGSGGSEALWTEAPAYDSFAVIEYNADPIVAGKGSAIFLHVSLGRPTNGCVSLPSSDLITTLRWLQPGESPHVAIGTAGDIDAY